MNALTIINTIGLIALGVYTMTTWNEATEALVAVKAQIAKAKAEILANVAKLEEIIAAGNVSTPEFDTALADLKGSVQDLDDLNKDAPTEPTP